jgi:putative transposase
VLAEQHDEWAEPKRYLGLDVLSKSRSINDTPTEQEDIPAALTAWNHHHEESHDDVVHHVPGHDHSGAIPGMAGLGRARPPKAAAQKASAS